MRNAPTPRAYTLAEAAAAHPLCQQYRITEKQLRRAAQSGRIAYARPGGRIILLTDADIAGYIARSRVEVGEEA